MGKRKILLNINSALLNRGKDIFIVLTCRGNFGPLITGERLPNGWNRKLPRQIASSVVEFFAVSCSRVQADCERRPTPVNQTVQDSHHALRRKPRIDLDPQSLAHPFIEHVERAESPPEKAVPAGMPEPPTTRLPRASRAPPPRPPPPSESRRSAAPKTATPSSSHPPFKDRCKQTTSTYELPSSSGPTSNRGVL